MAIVIDDTIISNQEQNLRAAMSTDPKMRKVIQQHIREALYEAFQQRVIREGHEELSVHPYIIRYWVVTSIFLMVSGQPVEVATGTNHHASSYQVSEAATVRSGVSERSRSWDIHPSSAASFCGS